MDRIREERHLEIGLIGCVEVGVSKNSTLEPSPVETRSFLLALNALFLTLPSCPSGLDQTWGWYRKHFMLETHPSSPSTLSPISAMHSVSSTPTAFTV